MTFSFRGAECLLTGAASGLGAAFCARVLKEGAARVLAVDSSRTLLEQTCAELQREHPTAEIVAHVCDITDKATLEEIFERHSSPELSVVVNCAGTGKEHEDWRRTLDVNLVGAIHGTQLAIQAFSAAGVNSKRSVIVNVSSMAGLVPMPFGPVYTASKHGLVGFSRCFAHLAPAIRVNALCPAFVDTPLVSDMLQSPGRISKPLGHAIDSVGGLLRVDTVEEAFVELCLDEKHNGAVMRVTNTDGATPHRF